MAHVTGAGPTRILFVSDERAWPPISGYRHRTRLILSALAAIGQVTWVVAPRNRFDGGEPIDVPERLQAAIEPILALGRSRGRAATLARWCITGLPWPLAAGDWSAADDVLARSVDPDVDLIWAMGLDALAAVDRAGLEAPVVVVDADLESLKLARERTDGQPRSAFRAAVARVDVGRWRRLESAAARERSGFSVCSEEERQLLGGTAFVTPNAYPEVDLDGGAAGGAAEVGGGAPLLFVGSMGYEPNRQGLGWFVEAILPRIRRHRPEARLRIVGSGPPVDSAAADAAGVEVIGLVDELGPELRAAAAVVVPVLWGAGTRIKLIEAMANRVPVVSTTVGAEGLGLVHGRHLQLADDPEQFAQACVRALDADAGIAEQV
ncbi:MAG: glycosyltransferase family 4 protein, partial [Actinomycetota bacterium]